MSSTIGKLEVQVSDKKAKKIVLEYLANHLDDYASQGKTLTPDDMKIAANDLRDEAANLLKTHAEEKVSLLSEILSLYTEAMDAAEEAQEKRSEASKAGDRQKNIEIKLSALLAAATDDDRSEQLFSSEFSTFQFHSEDD